MSGRWTDRPVLVTGGTGLVGGWLTRRLLELGAEVLCLVRDRDAASQLFRDGLADRVRLVYGDVCDGALLERVLGEREVDTVLHLAAQTIVPVAQRNAVSTFESNVRGTWTLLEAARRSPRVTAIVHASSDKAYGDADELPYTEATPLAAVHPYDVSKACSDMIAQSYARSFDVPVVVTRCGNIFGGGDLNWNRIVPGTIRSALRGERPVIRSDGTLVRDYFYVEDVVEAYLLAAEHLSDRPELRGEAFNFSAETPLSVRELADRILKAMSSDLELDVRGVNDGEIERQILSSDKAREVLGWRPHYELDDALGRTIAWYEDHLQAGRD